MQTMFMRRAAFKPSCPPAEPVVFYAEADRKIPRFMVEKVHHKTGDFDTAFD